MSELCSDTLWNSWITKEDDQTRENVRLQNPTDSSIYKKKKKMRALILQGGGALGAFRKQVLSKHCMKSLQEKIKKMEMREDHYLI